MSNPMGAGSKTLSIFVEMQKSKMAAMKQGKLYILIFWYNDIEKCYHEVVLYVKILLIDHLLLNERLKIKKNPR